MSQNIDLAISMLTMHFNCQHEGISRNRYSNRVEYFKHNVRVLTLSHNEIINKLSTIEGIQALVLEIDQKYSAALADKLIKNL